MPRFQWFIKDPYSPFKGLIRMSWAKENLYNLANKTTLTDPTRKSVFQQRWVSKRDTRGYHVPNIPQRQFIDRHFNAVLPTKKMRAADKERCPPIQTLMYAELERRVDVTLFRSHFCDSIWSARKAVVSGHVLVNGVKCKHPAWRLSDGDMVTINPKVIPTLVYPQKQTKTEESQEIANQEDSQDTLKQESKESTIESQKDLTNNEPEGQPFKPVEMMEPWMFTPEYLEVDYNTCSTIFLRSPLPTPDRMEIPSPYPPLWHQLAYDWYANIARSGRKNRTKKPLVINSSLVNLKPKYDRLFRNAALKEGSSPLKRENYVQVDTYF